MQGMIEHIEGDRRTQPTVDARVFLGSMGVVGQVEDYRPAETVYSQGDPSGSILYIQQGTVKLTVISPRGKEAVVGMLGDGEFFGEGALAGQTLRVETATAMTASRIRIVPKGEMIRLLHQQDALSDRFIAHLLARNHRLEEDLVDQLFNTCEKRLARTLFLLARSGSPGGSPQGPPVVSQEVLAQMVGTTRSRVNAFMNYFRKRGFIDYGRGGGITIRPGLLRAVLRDSPAEGGSVFAAANVDSGSVRPDAAPGDKRQRTAHPTLRARAALRAYGRDQTTGREGQVKGVLLKGTAPSE